MSTFVFQVTLNVPDGSGLELDADTYAGVLEGTLNDALESGKIQGASQVEVDFQEVV